MRYHEQGMIVRGWGGGVMVYKWTIERHAFAGYSYYNHEDLLAIILRHSSAK